MAAQASGLFEYSNAHLQAQANARIQADSEGGVELDLFGIQGRYHRPKQNALWRFGEQAGFSGPGLNGAGFTGVSYVSDFGFTPNHSHFNTLSFEGATGLPGDVEFYIGEAKIGETISVDRGEFRLEDIPSIDGNGTVSVVLTDKFGRKTTQSIPYFNMPGIYKKGAYEFQYGFGLISRGRGIYHGFYGSSVQRYGLTDRITASGSVAFWPGGALLGGGAQHAWREKTMVNATAAASASGLGLQVKANLSPATRPETFNWGAQLTFQNHAWRQIGQGPEDAPNFQAAIRGFLALNLTEKDTLSTSLMVQKKWDTSLVTAFSTQWTRTLNENGPCRLAPPPGAQNWIYPSWSAEPSARNGSRLPTRPSGKTGSHWMLISQSLAKASRGFLKPTAAASTKQVRFALTPNSKNQAAPSIINCGSATAHLPPLDITPVAVCWAARMEHFSQRQNWDNNMRW